MRIRDFVKRPPVTITPNATIRDAAELMAKEKIGLLVVVEGGRIAGVVSERDIVRAVAFKVNLSERVEKIMTKTVVTIEADAHVREAAELFRLYNIRHLVVTERGTLYGVISIRDIVKEQRLLEEISNMFELISAN